MPVTALRSAVRDRNGNGDGDATALLSPSPSASLASPTSPSRLSRERMLARIREAAITEFGLHGFKGASTQAIAERAGLTKPQLHYYIKGKDELYEELLFAVLQGWVEAFAFDAAGSDPRRVLANYIDKKLAYALEQPGLSRIFTNELLGGGPNLARYWPQALRSAQQKIDAIDGWIAAGQMRALDARLLLMHIWAMTQHYADYAVQVRVMLGQPPDAPIARAPIARELTSFVLMGCGLAPQAVAPAPRAAARAPSRGRARR